MTLLERLWLHAIGRTGWRIVYYWHGSVVIESPTGFRERHAI